VKCKNLRAFDFFFIIEPKYVKWDIENWGFIDISCGCLKTLIALVVYLMLIANFEISEILLKKDNLVQTKN